MNILGLSFYYHDSAAALVQDGRLVAAAEEERFSRVKHDSGFPALAVDFCLRAGGVSQGHRFLGGPAEIPDPAASLAIDLEYPPGRPGGRRRRSG